MDNSLKQNIDQEYEACALDSSHSLDKLCEYLMDYLGGVVYSVVGFSSIERVRAMKDDLVNTAITIILSSGFENFKPEYGSFATYCGAIAKNKALSAAKSVMLQYALSAVDLDYADENEQNEGYGDEDKDYSEQYQNYYGRSPESIMIKQFDDDQFIRICRDLTAKYLKGFMELDYEAHKLVASGFSLILSKKKMPGSRDVAMPTWAFEQIKSLSVEDAGDTFEEEMNSWIPYIDVSWGSAYYDSLEDELLDERCGDVVYGEHYTPHHIENWDLGVRNKLRKTLGKQEFDSNKDYFRGHTI